MVKLTLSHPNYVAGTQQYDHALYLLEMIMNEINESLKYLLKSISINIDSATSK